MHTCEYACVCICVCMYAFICACVYVCIYVLFVVSACYWRGRLCFGGGRDRSFVCIFLFFAGIRVVGVCVLVYARTHT